MPPDLLETILTSYQLPPPLRTEQIHNGTHRVYRAHFGAGSGHSDIAIKVSRRGDGDAIRAKDAEFELLARLEHALNFVPRFISPPLSGVTAQRFPWGIIDHGDRIVSCYYWRHGVPYSGQALQLVNVARAYQEMRQNLSALDYEPKQYGVQRVHYSDRGLSLHEQFGFEMFRPRLDQLDADSPTTTLLRQQLRFLEQETQQLRDLVASEGFAQCFDKLELLHLELSPSNFSFHQDDTVSTVYDFDSLTVGVWLQELAWLVSTFCIDYRRSFDENAKPLRTLLRALLELQILDPYTLNGYLLPFMRFAYLDSIYRKLDNAFLGIDQRLGFVKEDIRSLLWLREQDRALRTHFASLC